MTSAFGSLLISHLWMKMETYNIIFVTLFTLLSMKRHIKDIVYCEHHVPDK